MFGRVLGECGDSRLGCELESVSIHYNMVAKTGVTDLSR